MIIYLIIISVYFYFCITIKNAQS